MVPNGGAEKEKLEVGTMVTESSRNSFEESEIPHFFVVTEKGYDGVSKMVGRERKVNWVKEKQRREREGSYKTGTA